MACVSVCFLAVGFRSGYLSLPPPASSMMLLLGLQRVQCHRWSRNAELTETRV